MTKYNLKSAIFVAITLPLFFAGCAGQLPPEQPRQQDLPAESKVDNDYRTPPKDNPADDAKEPRKLAEELPIVADESAVFFTLGSATLGYKDKQKLEAIAERLVGNKHLHVLLIGYANDNGSSSFNLAVSDKRVAAVAEFLRKQGVQGGQIRVQALGSEKVASSCRSSKCRQQFRRVDLLVDKGK